MTAWFEQLARLREEQEPREQPRLYVPVPQPVHKPEEDKHTEERGVVIIGADDDDESGVIITM